MSGIVQREGNRIDATYTTPWGGVASDADNADIQPSQFVQGDGVLIRAGKLCLAGWGNTTLYNYSEIPNAGFFVGIRMQLVLLVKKSNAAWITVALDDLGRAYYYDPSIKEFFLDKTLTGGGMLSFSCWQVSGGVVYIFDYSAHAVYRYDPFTSYTQIANFVAGNYCMMLDNYLITADTNMPSDTPATKENRYNWSAPFAFGTWDPQDPALPRGAGFNTLSSAQDQISGLFAMGNVGYILRTQGLTQLSPTGIGIAPFDPTDLWASTFGIGCTYPDTFSQYGSLAVWFNNNNGYAFFSGTVPQDITGSAKVAIFKDINQYELNTDVKVKVSGAFSNSSENTTTPELCYVLTIISQGPGVPSGMQAKIWTLNTEAKAWTRQVFNIGTKIQQLTGNTGAITNFYVGKSIGVQEPNALSLITRFPPRRIATNMLVTIGIGATDYSFMFALYYNSTGLPSLSAAEKGLALLFREEELRIGTRPTVRGVIVKAAGSGTLSIRINTHVFSDIVLDGTSKTKVYKSHGEISEENPSLLITSQSADAYITKASMNMTYDEGSPF